MPEPEYDEYLLELAATVLDNMPGTVQTNVLTDEEKAGYYMAALMLSKPAGADVSLADIKRHMKKALSIRFPPN